MQLLNVANWVVALRAVITISFILCLAHVCIIMGVE